jgi:hypothetical protein
VLSQSSFYSSNEPRLHFGLGAESPADIEVIWPNGLKEKLKDIGAHRLLTIKEGVGILSGKNFPTK